VPWQDHVHTETAFLARGEVGVAWLDFRFVYPYAQIYQFGMGEMAYSTSSSSSTPVRSGERISFDLGFGYLHRNVFSGSGIGHVFATRGTGLHAHFVMPFAASTPIPTPVSQRSWLWSPVNPPGN